MAEKFPKTPHLVGWFNFTDKPSRAGVYAVLTLSGIYPPKKWSFRVNPPYHWYSYWDGEKWSPKCSTVEDALLCSEQGDKTTYQRKVWSGLTKEYYDKLVAKGVKK